MKSYNIRTATASGRISVFAEEAAGVQINLKTKKGPMCAEVRLDIVHPQWLEENHARQGLNNLAAQLSKKGQIDIRMGERRECPGPYMVTTTIEAEIFEHP